ncbi:hypothetical protein ACFSL4_00325 [Streptomyces caeni]|uniref:Uncharacterized protein n=1 Tax=Streptomyces caeni TaxID=2307231 RepID=A0ABW4IIJ4_9ACTN
MISTCTTPWMVVMMLGFCTRRGRYSPHAPRVLDRAVLRPAPVRLLPGGA